MRLHQGSTSESNLVQGIAEHIVSSFLEEKRGKNIPQSFKWCINRSSEETPSLIKQGTITIVQFIFRNPSFPPESICKLQCNKHDAFTLIAVRDLAIVFMSCLEHNQVFSVTGYDKFSKGLITMAQKWSCHHLIQDALV